MIHRINFHVNKAYKYINLMCSILLLLKHENNINYTYFYYLYRNFSSELSQNFKFIFKFDSLNLLNLVL